MWIFSQHGFFSIVKVEPREPKIAGAPRPLTAPVTLYPDGVVLWAVRARDREDLVRLLDLSGLGDRSHKPPKIRDDIGGDYPVRAFVTADRLHALFAALPHSITYTNFKSRCGVTLPDRAPMLHRIWQVVGDTLGWRR